MPRSYALEAKLVKKIKDCDPQRCWDIIKKDVGTKIFGDECIAIPYLDEASRYDLNAVIMMKRKQFWEKMLFLSHQALSVNMLQEMIRSDITSLDSVKLTRPEKINKRFHQDAVIFGSVGQKTIAVRLKGLSMYQISHVPEEGDIMIDVTPYFGNFMTHFIYLVTKVIYASEMRMRVMVGNHLDEFRVRRKIPVAFQLTKYNILYNAILGTNEPVIGEPSLRWIKYSTVPIPRTLLVERENRGGGDDGKRQNGPRNIRHRSILREDDNEE